MSVKFSIITATYNCESTLQGCLESVSSQNYKNREHLIIDGGSTDNTKSIIRAHANQLACIVSEPDNGIYDALNKGLARASGDVIGFMHADDLYGSMDALRSVAAAFEDPDVTAVYGDLDYVRQNDIDYIVRRWRSSPFQRRQLDWGWMPPHPTLFIRRTWYQEHGGFDTSYQIAADYALILNLFSQADNKFVYLSQVLVKMRLGGASNRSLRNVLRKSLEDWKALRAVDKGALACVGALAFKNISKLTQFRGGN